MIKVEVILHLSLSEDEIGCTGQQALEKIREMIKEAAVEEGDNCKVVKIKFFEEEVEPF